MAVRRDKDVVGLYVPVNNHLGVECRDRVHNGPEGPERVDYAPLVRLQTVRQRPALKVLHDEPLLIEVAV